ncbi:MAG: type IX secretion system sortase PorU [Tannerellaceae bacterium]
MIRLLYTLLICLSFLSSVWAGDNRYVAKSALSEGRWVKIRVNGTGIYKLTFSELAKMGFADPSKVSVHGYGGWPLSEDFKQPYIDDLPAVGVWKGTDYLLFYARGTVQWTYDTESKSFIHTNNSYANAAYYFITDAFGSKEMPSVPSTATASLKLTTFDDYRVYEKDLVSVNASGRELFGELFVGNLSQNFSFSIPGITNEPGLATFRFIAKATTGTAYVSMDVDEKQIINTIMPSSSVNDSYTKAIAVEPQPAPWNGDKKESTKVTIAYSQRGHTNVFLDYIRLQMKRTLKPYGAYTFFRSLTSIGNASRFVVQNATANTLIFDVSDPLEPKKMEAELSGSELSFTIPAGALREFVAVQTDQTFPTPEMVGVVAAQNLHGLPQTDMIIISPAAFVAQAERLAEEHRTRDGMTVSVVKPEDIYNEFSSGTPDATAYRRFMKMFYDRGMLTNPPRYLLLLGDGAYDNRGLTADWKKMPMENMLLTYQSYESLGMYSYATDDYFGFLDDNEGLSPASATVDIGIGRFPVRTVEEATAAVDKVIAYMENKQPGSWKNRVSFVADDGSNMDGYTNLHMEQSNSLASYTETSHPEYLVNKIFFDAFKKSNSGGNGSYPDVTASIQRQFKNGLLLINYTGHGNTQSLSDEHVLTLTDIAQATYPCLPLWITATCDFTRFDALTTSAGEVVFLNPKSGGIGLYTTTRVVDADANFRINTKLIENLFVQRDGRNLTLGEVMKQTKRSLGSDQNKLNFVLIGDPAMTLAYPDYQMKITAINGNPLTDAPVTFKALQKITIRGEVLSPDGKKATDFFGQLNPTVLDSKVTMTTLNNNKTGNPFSYTDYPNTLFLGNDSVRAGEFSFTFTVPKDISYSDDFGKMNLYACDTKAGHEARGIYQNFVVGGTSDSGDKDTEGPEIRALFLNDTSFEEGGAVNTTPLFVASLWDKSGVNISGSGIGHDMMLIIDNKPVQSYPLNSFYASLPGTDGEGIVKFSIPALSPGLHTAEFRVWDVQNNSTLRTFTFVVEEGLKPAITDLTAGPVPARDKLQFYLYHNRPEANLTVGIYVYDMQGRLCWQHEESGSSELFKAYTIGWNLTTNGGTRLRPGVYLYRATISTDHSKEATAAKKLIILAQ